MAMRKNQKNTDDKTDKTLTVIAQGAVVNGKLKTTGKIIIHGSLEGEISSSEFLTVAPAGVVDAIISSRYIYVNGQVRGTLHTETLHLDTQARLVGDVHTRSLQITEGAFFQGSCTMPDEKHESNGEVISLTRSA